MFNKNLVKSNMKYKNYNMVPFDNLMNHKSDYKLQKFGRCNKTYNFKTSSGALTDGIRIGELKFIRSRY